MPKIVPSLWFDDQAEEAANFLRLDLRELEDRQRDPLWISASETRGDRHDGRLPAPGPGRQRAQLRSGVQRTEALSLLVSCRSQEEVDELWDKLRDGGEPGPCGWLKDRYGLSWQIVPVALGEMLSDHDSAKSQRVMEAMLQMGKIDVARVRQAYEA